MNWWSRLMRRVRRQSYVSAQWLTDRLRTEEPPIEGPSWKWPVNTTLEKPHVDDSQQDVGQDDRQTAK